VTGLSLRPPFRSHLTIEGSSRMDSGWRTRSVWPVTTSKRGPSNTTCLLSCRQIW